MIALTLIYSSLQNSPLSFCGEVQLRSGGDIKKQCGLEAKRCCGFPVEKVLHPTSLLGAAFVESMKLLLATNPTATTIASNPANVVFPLFIMGIMLPNI